MTVENTCNRLRAGARTHPRTRPAAPSYRHLDIAGHGSATPPKHSTAAALRNHCNHVDAMDGPHAKHPNARWRRVAVSYTAGLGLVPLRRCIDLSAPPRDRGSIAVAVALSEVGAPASWRCWEESLARAGVDALACGLR